MFRRTDDLRIQDLRPLISPAILMEDLPLGERGSATVAQAREEIAKTLWGRSDRLLVVIGPCSIHDTEAALEYARLLADKRRELSGALDIVMRVYFEKPRTTVGWKGLINDPHLDGSFAINQGLRAARRFLLDVVELGLPSGTEFLIQSRRSSTQTSSRGVRSAPARPRARCTASWRRACRCRSASRTARRAA
jgi:3-deoxy-7-phosphoheptulonate synthase